MASKTIILTPEVRDVLERSTITGNSVKLPLELARPLYVAVNKALESAGGRWDRTAKAHLFKCAPRVALDLIKEKGVFAAPVDPEKLRQQQLQAYYTPSKLAQQLVALADVRGRHVLEPSCGDGALVRACIEAPVRSILVVEVDPEAYRATLGYLHTLRDEDFYGLRSISPVRYAGYNGDFLAADHMGVLSGMRGRDRVVMNPPFADGQDFQHICRALQFVAHESGMLTSVIAGDSNMGALENKVKRGVMKCPISFDYKVWPLPANSFKESGTGTHTAVIQISNLRYRSIPGYDGLFLPMLDW